MYAVIFKASFYQSIEQDEEYNIFVKKMRSLAFEKYNCQDFISLSEKGEEISISYWKSEEDIHAWKNDPEHLLAQRKGREKWYSKYTVQIAQINREYYFPVAKK